MNLDRAARTAELAAVGAKAGASIAVAKGASRFVSPERAAAMRERAELRSAEEVASVLGNMKGAVMKIGQMASYLDQGLPEPVREALAELRSDAPPMAPELVDDAVRAELGGSPGEVFAEFDPTPLAAASIGQVHRARTHDGAAVAVKVQYPGVDEAIRADLANSDLLFGALSMLFPGMDPRPIAEELRARIGEELDYTLEAANQRSFAEYYAGHPTIHVPAVREDLSTRRVLTTELADGASWSELLGWSEEERNLAAETLYRFAFGGIYRLASFNGDPHPGNYLFLPGGRVTFLDFGLCKRFTPEEVAGFGDLIKAMVFDDDMKAFASASARLGVLSDPERFTDEQIRGYFSHFYEFVLEDRDMTVTPEYASESVRRYFDLSSPHIDVMKAANLPPAYVIVQRINLGLMALFGELGATANWRRIAEEIWPWIDGPPSTPMGEAIREWEVAAGHRIAAPTAG